MIDFIKRLFGEGHIYTEFVCDDGTTGRGRAPYIGDRSTFDRNEYIEELKQEIFFKHGKRVVKITNLRIL